MNTLGSTIKTLLSKHGITAKELAQRVNLSETSLSKIVQGITKPRQANFTRIIEELCKSQGEEQELITAYALIEQEIADEQPQLDPETYQRIEEERVRSYLKAKARSIAFREQVATTLTASGIPFDSPYSNADLICDFLICGPPHIAIECNANPARDWDRAVTSARLLLKELPCDHVIVVVPEITDALSNAEALFRTVKLSELIAALADLPS